MKQLLLQATLLGWFFFVLDTTGNPQWKLGEFKSVDDCNAQRTAFLAAHFKNPNPDPVQASYVALTCFQSTLIQVQN